jgi:HK97 family phage prohead protease
MNGYGGLCMKQFFEPIEFNFFTKEVEFEIVKGKKKGFYVRGYASTSDVDRQDEIVSREALQAAEEDLLRNRTVFFEHNYSQPIGKVVNARVDNKGLFIEAYISETLPKIRILIKEGILNRFSIGGRVLEAGTEFNEALGKDITIIRRMELFEVSLVGVPANAEAKVIDYVLKSAVAKARGDGQGQGGSRQGDGGADICVCPKCGKEVPHEKGIPCKDIKCPECNTNMAGKNKNENTDKKEAEDMADEKKKIEETQVEGQPSVEEKESKKEETTEASVITEEKVVEKKEEEATEEKAEEVVEKKEAEEAKPEASEEEKKEEKTEEPKAEEKVEEPKKEEKKAEPTVEKKEEEVTPEDIVEKTTEEEVDLVKTISTKIDEIHKRVLSQSRPVMALYDEDVDIIASNIDKLEVGSDVTLMIKAKVVTKGKTETETEVYKGLELTVSDVEMVGEPTKAAVKEDEPVEEKKEETVPEEKVEKAVEKEEEPKEEVVEEKPQRKGIVEDNKDDTIKNIVKRLDGKTPKEVLEDDELFNSLDKDIQEEIKREYKKSMIR